MLTEKDYCDYETCVALKEIGCRIQTEWYIHQPSYERGNCYLCFGIPRETSVLDECDYIPRLSLYEAQKFLREEKGTLVYPKSIGDLPVVGLHRPKWYAKVEYDDYYEFPIRDTYEEALSEGIKEAVKILKKN